MRSSYRFQCNFLPSVGTTEAPLHMSILLLVSADPCTPAFHRAFECNRSLCPRRFQGQGNRLEGSRTRTACHFHHKPLASSVKIYLNYYELRLRHNGLQWLQRRLFTAKTTPRVLEDKDDISVKFDQHQQNDKYRPNSNSQQLQRQTKRLIKQLNGGDVHTKKWNGGWIMSQVHNIMFQWVILQPGHFELVHEENEEHYPRKSRGFIVESLLDAVFQYHQSTEVKEVRPTVQMFKYTMETWLQESTGESHTPRLSFPNRSHKTLNREDKISLEGLERAETLLGKLFDFVKDKNKNCIVGDNLLWEEGDQYSTKRDHGDVNYMVNSCFASVTHALLNQKVNSSIERAEEVFRRLCLLHGTTSISLLKNGNLVQELMSKINNSPSNNIRWKHCITSINAILHILVSKGDTDSLSITRNFVSRLVDSSLVDDGTIKPNKFTFNILLHGYAKVGDTKAVESLLQWIESLYQEGKLPFQSDTISFNILLNAYAKRGDIDSCMKAKRLLRIMRDNREKNCEPDIVSYTAVINALSRNGMAKESHRLLFEIINKLEKEGDEAAQPDRVIFSAVVDAWAKSKEQMAVERCWEIIHLMERTQKRDLAPSTVTFNSLIYAIGKSQDSNVCDKALEVLAYMKILSRQHDHINADPNITTYNTILSILGKIGIKEVRKFFDQMQKDDEIEINIISVNTFLDALARSKSSKAAEEALSILEGMKKKNHAPFPHVYPNTRTYNTVLNVISKSEPLWCEKVEQILDKMEALYSERRKSVNVNVIPNTITYTTAINAIARSDVKNKAERALALLRRMEKAQIQGNIDATPNTKTFNALLNACCFVNSNGRDERKQAISISKMALSEMNKWPNCMPDHVTFATMIKVSARNIVDVEDRLHYIEEIFKQCRSRKRVSNFVLKELRKSIPRQLYEKLTARI